jgi:glycerol-3-phosphate acyltransferase PlsY
LIGKWLTLAIGYSRNFSGQSPMPTVALWGTVTAVALLLAYLLGAFPTGYLVAKAIGGIDIREYGSRSTGATNVLRTLGKGPGLLTFGVDVAKGALAIALVPLLFSAIGHGLIPQLCPATCQSAWQSYSANLPWVQIGAGLCALLGHSKSIFLGFTGGKSVATSLGILLVLNWGVALVTFATFGVVLAVSRIVSLSSISGAIALPILMVIFHQPLPYLIFSLVGSAYVIFRHTANIQRLLQGTEPRLGQS